MNGLMLAFLSIAFLIGKKFDLLVENYFFKVFFIEIVLYRI
jgi:hypothetical protein